MLQNKFVLTRKTQNQIDQSTVEGQVRRIVRIGLRGTRGRGWKASFGKIKSEKVREDDANYSHSCEIVLRKQSRKISTTVYDKQLEAIHKRVADAGSSTSYGTRPWKIVGFDGKQESVKTKSDSVKDYGTVSLDIDPNNFSGIYGRDAHIARILSAVETAIQTNLEKRYHVLLHGPPGCGKTDILSHLCKTLGRPGEAYLMIDATSTTQAGIIKLLMEAPVIPPVLVVEEIEKAEESALRWLLGVLDQRGSITRINARVGYQYKNVRMLCLATANDYKLFQRIMSGALASRFSHTIYCPRPDEQVMTRILTREVQSISGDLRWVPAAIEFCMNELGMDDPREIIPICLCGKGKLLDGSYQKVIRATREV